MAKQQPDHEHSDALMKASRLQSFLDSVRLSLLNEGLLRRSQNLLGSTVADIERARVKLDKRAEHYLTFSTQITSRYQDSKGRLATSQKDHALKLELDIKKIFADLKSKVSEFAEENWDREQGSLNSAWAKELARFGFEQRIQNVQKSAMDAFSKDMGELLDEVGRELALGRHIAFNSGTLNEQDSSAWKEQASKWGGSVLGIAGSVLLFALGASNPIGWIVTGVGVVLGIISSLLESKETKRRKAVANISNGLHALLEKQSSQVLDAAVQHFNAQCKEGAKAVLGYFRQSIDGLNQVSNTLAQGAKNLDSQRNILNTHFAARVLDFANATPSETSAAALREQIQVVRRRVGEQLHITVAANKSVPYDFSEIESIIQEKIVLKLTGVHA